MPIKLLPKEQWTVIQTANGRVCLPVIEDNEHVQWCGPTGSQTVCAIGIREDGNSVYVDCSMADSLSAQIAANGGNFVFAVPTATAETQPPAATQPQGDSFRALSYTVAGNSAGSAVSASGMSLPLWAQLSLNIVVWSVVLALAVKFLLPWLREWKASPTYATQFRRPRSLRNRIDFEEIE